MDWSCETIPRDTVAHGDTHVTRGPDNPADADVAVIVMAVDTDPRALGAVRSIMNQAVSAELVLVNTGAGTFAFSLPTEILRRITLVESTGRRFPGGTRNLGIAHSTAPIVAFLAADCVAQPGWLLRRLAAHESGFDLVASTVRPNADERGVISSASWASYVLIHLHRAPHTEPGPNALPFGVSYRREVFERHGPFDEALRVSEDREYNRRLRDAGCSALWDREIVTLHDYPSGPAEAIIDQFWRGRIAAQHARTSAQIGLPACLRRSWLRNRSRAAAARVPRDDLPFENRNAVLRILWVLRWAHAFGVLSSILGAPGEAAASDDRQTLD